MCVFLDSSKIKLPVFAIVLYVFMVVSSLFVVLSNKTKHFSGLQTNTKFAFSEISQ